MCHHTRFQHRRAVAACRSVQSRFSWPDYLKATDDARGWSVMDDLIWRCDCVRARIRLLQRSDYPGAQRALRQNRETLRGLICAIQRIERGEPTALNGLSARIDPTQIPPRPQP